MAKVTGATDFLLPSIDAVRKFRKENQKKVSLGNLLLQIEWEVVSAIVRYNNVHHMIQMSFQMVHEYHRESLMLVMAGRPEIGLAVLRQSCELSRDLARMLEDEANADFWLAYRADKKVHYRRQQEYRDTFRFSADTMEDPLRRMYNLASNFGIHGHMTFTSKLSEVVDEHEYNLVIMSRDKNFAVNTFMLILMTVDFHCVLMLLKLKPISERQEFEARNAIGSLGTNYLARADPFYNYMLQSRKSVASWLAEYDGEDDGHSG